MTTEIRYKFLHGNKSQHGDHKWVLNKWYKIDGELKLCKNGFHCSKYIQDALNYVNGDILAIVEVKGNHLDDDDKDVWEEMRVVERYKFKKYHSIKIAVYSAKLCQSIYEEQYPDDDRIKNAIEAAELVIEHDTKKNRDAAASATESAWSAARSAASATESDRSARSVAWSAARSATESAWSAARSAASATESAWSAARSAAWSARSARSVARSAESAARSAAARLPAARSAELTIRLAELAIMTSVKNKIHDYILSLFKGVK